MDFLLKKDSLFRGKKVTFFTRSRHRVFCNEEWGLEQGIFLQFLLFST